MKIKLLFFVTIFAALIIDAKAQCPTTITISSNTKCMTMVWSVPPIPLPTPIIIGPNTYTYSSGAGTTANPALYNTGSSSGCNNYTGYTGTITLGSFICTYVNGTLTNETMPLNLISFEIDKNRDYFELKWMTTNEIEVAGFEIQRMDELSYWNSIDWIESNAKIIYGINTYVYQDKNPIRGLNYYRLKIFDNDGNFDFSSAVSYENENKDNFEACPNPASDQLYICSESQAKEISSLEIFNAQGKRVLTADNFSNSIDIHNLKPGMYILKAGFTEGTFKLHKIIKY